jgi:hypothetical protein
LVAFSLVDPHHAVLQDLQDGFVDVAEAVDHLTYHVL